MEYAGVDGELPDGAVLPLDEQVELTIDALDSIDRRTWQKRKMTGEEAANKRAAFVAPAGQGTASAGIIRPRNNEVLETPIRRPAVTDALPDNVKLVVTASKAHTKGATEVASCAVDCLESLLEDGAAVELPAARRAFYAVMDGVDGSHCAAMAARELPRLLARRRSHLPLQGHSSAVHEWCGMVWYGAHPSPRLPHSLLTHPTPHHAPLTLQARWRSRVCWRQRSSESGVRRM